MIWLEFTYSPSIAVHLLILSVFIICGSLVLLRYIKALFIYLEYKNRTGEDERRN